MAPLARPPARRPKNPVDDAILVHLASFPFLRAYDLEEGLGVTTPTMHRTLTRLCAAGLVERVPLGEDKTLGYCLTGDGGRAAATAAGKDPAWFYRIYALDRRQLLARLPLLHRLAPAQTFVVEMASALTAVGASLGFYKAGPLHWHGAHRGKTSSQILLDGMGCIDLVGTATGADAAPYWFGLLWDGDGAAPTEALRYQVDRLRALWSDDEARLPPVLVVTTAAERLGVAGTPSGLSGLSGLSATPPIGVVYTTVAEYGQYGPLGASWVVRRRGGGSLRLPLLDLLTRQPWARHNPWDLTVWPRARVQPGDALGLERRVTRLRTGHIEGTPTPTGLLALALPRGVIGVLAAIGSHPLLDARMIGEITGRNASVLRDEVGWLRALDLIQVYYRGLDGAGRPRFVAERERAPGVFGVGERPVMTYALTRRGTHLLAARVGLPPATYRIVHKALDASPKGDRAGLTFALGNAAHTLAIQEVFVALRAAITRRAGTLRWLWEWGCVVPLRDREEDRERDDEAWEAWEAWEDRDIDDAPLNVDVLRPDARLLATVADATGTELSLDVYVEVDRSTETHSEIAGKLRLYHRHARIERRRVEEARGGEQIARPPLTVAFVTTESEERAVNVLQTAKDVARELESRAVRVVAIHLDTMEGRDLFKEIWIRDAYPERSGPISPRRCFLVPDLARLAP